MAAPTRLRPAARRHRRVAAITAAFAMALTAAALPASASTASPRDRLRAAAHGTLTSGFGTLQFRGGGNARFLVKECATSRFAPVS